MLTRFPRVAVVIDDLNPEAFADLPRFAAFEQLAQLARHPRLYAKLLPLAAHSARPFPYADLLPAYECLYHAFGAQRLIWGSGWPDTRTALPYPQTLAWGRSLPFFASSELDGFLGGTARRLWRLPIGEVEASA
jgi:L-fuconolactonase